MSHFLSDDFFHLVGRHAPRDDERNYGTLKLILESEFVKYPGAADRSAPISIKIDLTKSLASGELVVPTMTCYCDIPVNALGFHASKYGRFGLGFHRDLLIRRGARPVMYVPMRADDTSSIHGSTLLRDIDVIYRAYDKNLLAPIRARTDPPHVRRRAVGGAVPDEAETTIDLLETLLARYFMAYVKAYDSQLATTALDYFYSEREWRMMSCLTFSPDEVTRVVVAKGFESRARSELPKYADRIEGIEFAPV